MSTPEPRSGLTRVGIASWSIVGVIVLLSIVLGLLAAVSELVLPFVFAVMLGVTFAPLVTRMRTRGVRASIAALIVVVGIILSVAAVVLLTIDAVASETGAISAQIDDALDDLGDTTEEVGVDDEDLTAIRDSIASIAGIIGKGLLTLLVGGLGALIGFVGSAILSMLIMYYVLKDGAQIRDFVVEQFPVQWRAETRDFLQHSATSVRGYWAGRSVVSAAVTVVVVVASLLMGLPLVGTIAIVNFLGGYVPYIGAFIGGGLATMLALADGGLPKALLMLAIVLVANLLLENLIEPRVMSGRLRIHPLVVLLATTAGGVIGGIVGLILAVPLTAITIDLVGRLRQSGALSAARARAEPVLRQAVDPDGTSDQPV